MSWLHTSPTEKRLRGWTRFTCVFSDLKVVSSWLRAFAHGEVVQGRCYSCVLYPNRDSSEEKDRPCSESRAGFLPQNHRDVQFCIKLMWLVQPQRESGVVGSRIWISNSSSFSVFTRSELSFSFNCPNCSFFACNQLTAAFASAKSMLVNAKDKIQALVLGHVWPVRVPSRDELISSFFLLKTSVLKCSDIPILGFFTFMLGMGKKEGGTEYDKTRQQDEADSLSTHRLTDQLGHSSHSFFNLSFNWSVKTAVLWRTQAGRDFVQHTWGQIQARWWWGEGADCSGLAAWPWQEGDHSCLNPPATTLLSP